MVLLACAPIQEGQALPRTTTIDTEPNLHGSASLEQIVFIAPVVAEQVATAWTRKHSWIASTTILVWTIWGVTFLWEMPTATMSWRMRPMTTLYRMGTAAAPVIGGLVATVRHAKNTHIRIGIVGDAFCLDIKTKRSRVLFYVAECDVP